jgi:hypothetical protein
MSETSRTDRAAEDNRYHECWASPCCVSVDFARQLELELKNAREVAAKYEDRYFETKEQRDMLAEAAQAVVDRWETPFWEEVGQYHYIDALRKAVAAVKGGGDE